MKNQDFLDTLWVKIRMEKGRRTSRNPRRLPVTKKQARALVEAVFETIEESVARGETIHVPRFGKFVPKAFAEGAEIYNPKTKTKVPRRQNRLRSVRFKASSVFLDRLNVPADQTP